MDGLFCIPFLLQLVMVGRGAATVGVACHRGIARVISGPWEGLAAVSVRLTTMLPA